MKDIRLQRLVIDRFKGQSHLELPFGGKGASIYGDNATGKSTIYDALTWLLFGKDSAGQSNFEVKPLNATGEIADHGAVTLVEAAFLADGQELVLRKSYCEKWSIKRGGAAEVFDGNTSEYFTDGVPVKKYAFDACVADLVCEDKFRMLTAVTWFCSGLGWQARRKALFDVCGIASDAEILAGAKQFSPLAAAMGRLSLDDYKAKLQAERKGLSGTRNMIPARMDECRKSIDELSGIDYAGLRLERATKGEYLEQLQSELLKLGHGALLDSKRNELGALKNELSAYVNENNVHRTSQIIPFEDKRPALNAEIARKKQELLRCLGLAENEKLLIESENEKITQFRARWSEADSQTLDDGACCPACGQSLPENLLQAAQERFEAEKETRKGDIISRADMTKHSISAAEERRNHYIQSAVEAENDIARLADALNACAAPEESTIEDLPGFSRQVELAQGKIHTLEETILKLTGESTAIREEACAKIQVLHGEIGTLDSELAKEGLLSYNQERVESLREEAQNAAAQLNALDKMLFLCDEFTRYKVHFIEESINGRFRFVHFRLFQEQVNGGLADCCEAMVDGVPYGSLNSGAKINAGLDVISTLSEHYGVSVPLFVDNAESVTTLLGMNTQIIRLVVSENDKKLRCAYEN